MQTWEKKEKSTQRIALIASICLHILIIASLSAYSSSGSDGSFIDWAKGIFQSEKVEQSASQTPST